MLRLFRHLFRKKVHKKAERQQARPIVECLEQREVMSVSGPEQLFIYLLNRARNNPAAYAQEQNLSVSLGGVEPRAPLALNNLLSNSSEFKVEEMADYSYFAHQSEVTGKWPNQLAREAGYSLPSYFPNNNNYIESLAYGWGMGQPSGVNTAAKALNLLLVDAGVNPPGHRIHLLGMSDFAADFREVGVGHEYRSTDRNTDYWAIHTGWVNTSDTFLTGVIFNDADGDGRYDLGEGLNGVNVQAGGLSTTTNNAGGWSIRVSQNTTYTVTASGGSFSGSSSVQVGVGSENIEVDFLSGRSGAQVNFVDVNGVGKPTVTGPASTVASQRPTITWTDVANADHYEIIVTDRATSAEVINVSNVSATSLTPSSDLPQGDYRVRVRAVNSDGDPGQWSAARDFTVNVPLPSAPQVTGPASKTADTTPTFTWTESTNAVSYQIVIHNLTTGAKNVIDQSGLTETDFTAGTDLAYGQYRVKVRAVNTVGEVGAWSAAYDFRLKAVLTPTITGPTGSTSDRTPTFSWTAAEGADFYVLVVNNLTTGQKNVLLVNDLTGTSYTPTVALTPGQYKVKVQGYKSNGLTGAFSVAQTFTVV